MLSGSPRGSSRRATILGREGAFGFSASTGCHALAISSSSIAAGFRPRAGAATASAAGVSSAGLGRAPGFSFVKGAATIASTRCRA